MPLTVSSLELPLALSVPHVAPPHAAAPAASSGHLTAAALLGIAVVVVLITAAKVHPFVSLILGSAVLGLVAGLGAAPTVDSFTKGVGSTVGSVGLLIALGAMIGGLLADSGGADEIVDTVVGSVSARALPWALVAVAALVGLPLFFEVGVVLLVPVVLLASRRVDAPLMRLGIPALAGLSVLHGLVPPHPGPLAAIAALKADLGLTLLYGLILAVPTAIIAGPLFGNVVSRFVHAEAPATLLFGREPVAVGATASGGSSSVATTSGAGTSGGTSTSRTSTARGPSSGLATGDAANRPVGESFRDGDPALAGSSTPRADGFGRRRPAFGPVLVTMLLPIVLMLLRAIGELTLSATSPTRKVLDVVGNPVVALLAGVLVAMVVLGYSIGASRERVSASLGGALPPIAGILLIVAAGGGFKQVLVDAGVGNLVADAAKGASLSPLLLAWLVAVGIRVATGSATVATITAAGIVTPLAGGLSPSHVALLVLAIGSGSLFFSHVNDAGFWLVKEYFGLSVWDTIKSWSLMETLISVLGLLGVLLLALIV
jgi:GntP family gluconate:H+ symporter